MHEVEILDEFYFSRILGKPIFDAHGRKLGVVKDMAVRWDGASPQVVGIKYARKMQNLIPINMIGHCDEQGVRLVEDFSSEKIAPLQEDEIYVGKWLLDKQIIDLQGSKLVRVNDITLSWVAHEDYHRIVLVAVDIGVRGLFRRLGLEFLVTKWENHFIGWQYIKPLKNRTSSLQLNREKSQLSQLHPADIADIIEQLDYNSRASLLSDLDSQTAIEALAEMDLETQVEIIEQMDEQLASDILEEMPPDEAADILGELPDEKSNELLSLMESDDAEEVRELMQYEEDTAGALMTTEYIAFSNRLTAEQAINQLRELAPTAETIYYLYVTDEDEHLQGVLSLRELIVASPATFLEDLMHTNIVAINDNDNHDKVADTIRKYGLLAVPVIDEQNKMLGIITVDDIIHIIMPERTKIDPYSWLVVSRWIGRGR